MVGIDKMQMPIVYACAGLFRNTEGNGRSVPRTSNLLASALMVFGLSGFVCQMAYAGARDMTFRSISHSASRADVHRRPSDAAKIQVADEPRVDEALSPAARHVSQIADLNGDRRFLIVDKVHGKIILFENGKLTFNRPALTGESTADQFAPDVMTKPLSQQVGVKYKVTPAGRFTLTRGYDPGLGNIFDINELQGRDWSIAIHQVWLGRQSDHRDARLRSAMDQDKHITEGCVDVESGTIVQLWRLLPVKEKTPIYILPNDENLLTTLFQVHDKIATRLPSPAG